MSIKDCKYGIRIKNYDSGLLYMYNLGVRDRLDYTKAMLTNSLFLDFLKQNGLKIKNGKTDDVICIKFKTKSYGYKEEHSRLLKETKTTDEQRKEVFQNLLKQCEERKDLYEEKSADDIRIDYYENGVVITNKDGKPITYKMLYRSTGKAKDGSCMFIKKELHDKASNFLRMGIKLPKKDAPLVEIGAYSSLIASSIVGKIKINPKNILILKDLESEFFTNVISVETNDKKECIAKKIENYKIKNVVFDGQGLIDSSIFPPWGDGYVLLRHHMCKMACFKTHIQKFFKDYYGKDYENAQVQDMFGNFHNVKDIQLITTESAMKYLKFEKYGADYDYWCDWVYKNGCEFGVVKTAHKSKLGDVQKMSYQMINSLEMDIMPQVVEKSLEYIKLLKTDINTFIQYLRDNDNFACDYRVLVALWEQDHDFEFSKYFRERRNTIIKTYVNNFRNGKVIQDADNLVFCGSPYAMLLQTVGEDIDNDPTLKQEDGVIQCFTDRFENDEYLAGFRSPHNSRNNILYLHNVHRSEFFKYFDLGKQIIVLNTLHTDCQDRANG